MSLCCVSVGFILEKAQQLGAIPYDFPGAEYSHYGEVCTFDYIVKNHQLTDPAILKRARIIRGADTDRFNLAPQAAGLWAISAGLSHNLRDDHQVLETGLKVYDALYFGPGMYKMKSTAGIRFRLPARPEADVKRWQPDYWAATFNKLSGLL